MAAKAPLRLANLFGETGGIWHSLSRLRRHPKPWPTLLLALARSAWRSNLLKWSVVRTLLPPGGWCPRCTTCVKESSLCSSPDRVVRAYIQIWFLVSRCSIDLLVLYFIFWWSTFQLYKNLSSKVIYMHQTFLCGVSSLVPRPYFILKLVGKYTAW